MATRNPKTWRGGWSNPVASLPAGRQRGDAGSVTISTPLTTSATSESHAHVRPARMAPDGVGEQPRDEATIPSAAGQATRCAAGPANSAGRPAAEDETGEAVAGGRACRTGEATGSRGGLTTGTRRVGGVGRAWTSGPKARPRAVAAQPRAVSSTDRSRSRHDPGQHVPIGGPGGPRRPRAGEVERRRRAMHAERVGREQTS